MYNNFAEYNIDFQEVVIMITYDELKDRLAETKKRIDALRRYL
jgi:hypothetical protein